MDDVSTSTSSDLERTVDEAVHEHRRLLAQAEQRHRDWKAAVATIEAEERIGELREEYRASLFEAQAQQMRLATLLDLLGRVPDLDGQARNTDAIECRSTGTGEH